MEEIVSLAASCRVATDQDEVHSLECAYAFRAPSDDDDESGLLVSLECFVGASSEQFVCGDGLFLRVVGEGEARRASIAAVRRGAIAAELPFNEETRASFPDAVVASAESVLRHPGPAASSVDDVAPKITCYASDDSFVFVDGPAIEPDPSAWGKYDDDDDDVRRYWLNLSDGHVGDEEAAREHHVKTGRRYPLVVRLDTITTDPEEAVCFSYALDENVPVRIPNLPALLERRGIRVMAAAAATADGGRRPRAEEARADRAFAAATEASVAVDDVVPVPGPRLSSGSGSSRHVAPVVRTLLGGAVPELRSRYVEVAPAPLAEALDDARTQTRRLVRALAAPDAFDGARLSTRAFERAVGTGGRHDAVDYFARALEALDRTETRDELSRATFVPPSSELFAFRSTTTRTNDDGGTTRHDRGTVLSLPIPVREAVSEANDDDTPPAVPTVDLRACLDEWASPTSPTNDVAAAVVTRRFVSFPPYLILGLNRYPPNDDWTPRKLEVDVDVPEEIDLEFLRSTDAVVKSSVPNAETTERLVTMGYSFNAAARASVVGGTDVVAALNWIYDHETDHDFHDPLAPLGEDDGKDSSFDGKGAYALVGVVTHLGKRTDGGRYVCRTKNHDGEWVAHLGDDNDDDDDDDEEKRAAAAVLSKNPSLKHGYVYLFRRKDLVVGETELCF